MRHISILLAGLLLVTAACTLSAAPTDTPPTAVVSLPTDTPRAAQPPTQTPAPTNTPAGSSGGNITCTPRADWPTMYVVVSGDTLASIARRANSTVNELAAGNCLSNPNAINAGQQLRLPRPPQAAPPPTATFPPTNQPVGGVSVSASISGDAGFMQLLRGETVTLMWTDPPAGLWRASFVLALGGSVQTIAEDTNPADGISVSWAVPAGLNGQQLMANGRFFEGSAVAYSYPLNVSSAPPKGQGCEVSSTAGSTLTIYNQPDYNSGIFATAASGQYYEVLGRSLNGWYAVEAGGIPNVPPIMRLKWIPVDMPLYGRGLCAGLPPEPQPGQTATFSNTIIGISVDYPMGCSAVARDNFITLSAPGGGTTFEVTFGEAGMTRPPQEEAAACKSASLCIGSRTILSEGPVTLSGGLVGYRLELSGDPVKGTTPAVYTFIILSSRNMVLRGFGDLSYYNPIANSVRPA
jgi:LysM repeat protein